ncbi:hypothetical protein HNR39_000101 [Glaciimonas immobilis]|uniref:Uncharacterized protein n=1 Tax=Glaciimonas immobilis TaxID=728004 RepID=A0A840RNS3_9BURK|nr:hypothetical protein [Glaciimonas immobilis]
MKAHTNSGMSDGMRVTGYSRYRQGEKHGID